MAQVLVVSSDVVPLSGQACTGAGLRAWGLGEGLGLRGHAVAYTLPAGVASATSYDEPSVRLFAARGSEPGDAPALEDLLDELDPDVVVFQHWPHAALSRRPRSRIVVDFHGPLLLELLYREPDALPGFLDVKLSALAGADFFTCASRTLLAYYYAHLLLAGVDLRRGQVAVVPFSMPPELPERGDRPAGLTFVYGGVFLPWQDPVLGLRALVAELERAGTGELHMFGGPHPWLDVGTGGELDRLQRELEASDRVRIHPLLPRAELIEHYRRADVAWDLMARNPERELAFTSRTVEYLWCGLPVVHNDYADLSRSIADYGAGWTVDPQDAEAIRQTARSILADGDRRSRSRNAQQLVREQLTWDVTIDPLDDFCREPRPAARLAPGPLVHRDGATPTLPAAEGDAAAGEAHLEHAAQTGDPTFEPGGDLVYVPLRPELAAVLVRVQAVVPRPVRRLLEALLALGLRLGRALGRFR